MANLYEKIMALCKEKGIPGSKMCDDLGFSRSMLTELKKGRAKTLKLETAAAIADYFDITVDYLSGRERKKEMPILTKKDEQDIEKELSETLKQLESDQEGLMFSGEPLDDETKELLAVSLRNSMELAKKIAKEKYTPKKYRK
jgi:transcriptional regulator with XRE-family HTH domain